jgi:DNA mismatch repair protein mutL
MPDVINLLPDSLANQIAAGEVVQRPASVVKELLENSIDAGATEITLRVEDGGRRSIQVIDNGAGLSSTDARLCFERHATSKIHSPNDLESIQTMGFRGEALASIAAVAEVTLTTRREEDSVGVRVAIHGSRIMAYEPTSSPVGANFLVRNLFFNTPARRRFLKGVSVELKHIIAEFQRVALANPQISMQLEHDGQALYHLIPGDRFTRISGLFGRRIEQMLLPLQSEAGQITLEGYIGKPEEARKRGGEQFIFANGRYIRSPYLNRAIITAYGRSIPSDATPQFFLFLKVPPRGIDVNIHPTKTEVKFQDERLLWQMLNAAVRESLGRFGGVPQIDFSPDATRDLPYLPPSAPISAPEMPLDTSFNPFGEEAVKIPRSPRLSSESTPDSWVDLYNTLNKQRAVSVCKGTAFPVEGDVDSINLSEFGKLAQNGEPTDSTTNYTAPSGVLPKEPTHVHTTPAESVGRKLITESSLSSTTLELLASQPEVLVTANGYLVVLIDEGIMLVDPHRAHARVIYENLCGREAQSMASQKLLFPVRLEIPPDLQPILSGFTEAVAKLGVQIEPEGDNALRIIALPAQISDAEPQALVLELLQQFTDGEELSTAEHAHRLLCSMAFAAAVRRDPPLPPESRVELVKSLMHCQQPAYDPRMQPTFRVVTPGDIAALF